MFFPLLDVPSAAPMVVVVAPFSGAPAAELRAVDPTTFGILEHPFASIRTARINAQHFGAAVIGVDAESAVAHHELDVVTSQLFQAVSDVDVIALGAVLGGENQEFAAVAIVSAIVIVPEVMAVGVTIG